jgi:hypothetical protein
MTELWLPAVGFEGRYEISDQGRVRSLFVTSRYGSRKRDEPLVMAGSRDMDGRLRVVLSKDGKPFGRHVARMVLEAFVGHPASGHECRHRNGDAAQSDLANLEWATHAVNMADRKTHGTFSAPPIRRGERNGRNYLTEDDVRCIRAEPSFRGVTVMLARAFGIRSESVANIRRGLSWRGVT